jgi:hypothetical protein
VRRAASGHVRAKTYCISEFFSIKIVCEKSMADKGFQIDSRLRSLTVELHGLERDLKTGAISDISALQGFRHAVDEVRMTAWTAGELHNAQSERKELLASFLAAERIRRFAQMLRDLSADLEEQKVSWESGGVQTLFDSVNLLQTRLERLIRDHRATFRNLKNLKEDPR